MADEVIYSGLGDLRNASILHKEIDRLIFDGTDLRSTMKFIPFDAVNSAAMKVGLVGGADAMAAPGEVTQAANTALTDSSYTLTVAGYRLTRELSDLSLIGSPVGLELLAQLMVESLGLTITDVLAALFPSLSNSVGTSGVDLSTDDIFSAIYQLQSSNASGPFHCVLHPQQIRDLQESLRGEGGAMQWNPATADMLRIKGPGYVGEWAGVQFWKCDSVSASGGNRRGAMYSEQQAFAYTLAPVGKFQQIPGFNQVMGDSLMVVETQRKADYASTLLVGHAYLAVSEAQDSAGVLIATDE